jgi:hypothetical protein
MYAFVPCTERLRSTESIVVEISGSGLPNSVMVRATVQSWHPATPRARVRAGAEVLFSDEDREKLEFVSAVLKGIAAPTTKRRFPRLPVAIAAHYTLRNGKTTELVPVTLAELAIGGALLATTTPLEIGTELNLAIPAPGAAAPLEIAAKVSYHGNHGGTGVQFVTKDINAKRRMTELVRRFREA